MIQVKNISKTFLNNKVLNNISFDIEDGQFISIMGPSGAGKSTLLKILSNDLLPDEGQVLIDDLDITKLSDKARSNLRQSKIAVVYQFFNLIDVLNVKDNILLPNHISKTKLDNNRFDEITKLLQIDHILSSYPTTISGGEAQRVAIARALMQSPSVIFLDEPTGSLDTKSRNIVMDLLKQINEKYKTIIVQVTHDINTTTSSDRIIYIKDGELSLL